MTRSPFRKSYLDLLPTYKPYAFEFFLHRPSTKRCCTAALGQTPSLEYWSTIVQPSSRMSLLSPLLELSIASRMYRHFSRFDSLGWHLKVNNPPQQIILAQCVLLWDQSCSLMIQVRYFSGLSIVNLIFLLYCASNDICFCNIVCMWLYWALWDMESYFLVHLLYHKEGLGAAASEIHFIQVPRIQVSMSVLLLCSYYGVRKNMNC